jgi:hypothetical protein
MLPPTLVEEIETKAYSELDARKVAADNFSGIPFTVKQRLGIHKCQTIPELTTYLNCFGIKIIGVKSWK